MMRHDTCSSSPLSIEAATEAAPTLVSSKIRDWHWQRQAIVYIRQSTMQQVHEHRESTARQYALEQRAMALGWPKDRAKGNVFDLFGAYHQRSVFAMSPLHSIFGLCPPLAFA